MSFPIDILNSKGTIPTIIVLLILTGGLGVNNHINNSDTQMFEHVSAEIPHPVINTAISDFKEYFITHVENDKEEFREYQRQYELDRESDKEDKKKHDEILLKILLELQELRIMI